MAKKITATEAVRRFSDLLNTIHYRGARYTIVRGGKPVATLGPAAPAPAERTLGELKEILAAIPRLGDDAESFARNMQKVRRTAPRLPKKTAWE